MNIFSKSLCDSSVIDSLLFEERAALLSLVLVLLAANDDNIHTLAGVLPDMGHIRGFVVGGVDDLGADDDDDDDWAELASVAASAVEHVEADFFMTLVDDAVTATGSTQLAICRHSGHIYSRFDILGM